MKFLSTGRYCSASPQFSSSVLDPECRSVLPLISTQKRSNCFWTATYKTGVPCQPPQHGRNSRAGTFPGLAYRGPGTQQVPRYLVGTGMGTATSLGSSVPSTGHRNLTTHGQAPQGNSNSSTTRYQAALSAVRRSTVDLRRPLATRAARLLPSIFGRLIIRLGRSARRAPAWPQTTILRRVYCLASAVQCL